MKIFHSDTISWTELGDFVFIFNEVTGTFFKFEGVLKDLLQAIQQLENQQLLIRR